MPRRLEGDFDYIVVGAGTAGCIIANRLSADPRNRVLVLEAGGNDNWIWFHIPVGYLFAIGNPRSDWMFRTEAEPGLNGRSLAYPRGKVIGGSSAINAMISMRGQAADYDHWRQLGLTGWGYDDVLPRSGGSRIISSARASITAPAAAGASRRRGCPGPFSTPSAMPPRRWASSALPDFNTGDNEGISYFHVNQKRGRRWSSARGFLKPALNRPNLRLEKNVLVDRLIIEKGRAVGVRFIQGGEIDRGARQGRSDPLRRLDRIGAGAASLRHRPRRLAVAARHRHRARQARRRAQSAGPSAAARDLQGRGRAHAERDLLQSVPPRPDGPRLRLPPPRAADHGAVAARHLHPLRSRRRERANIQFHVQPLSLDKFGDPLHRFPAITVSACNLQPTSRGTVRIRSAQPDETPIDRAELSVDRRRPPGRRRRHPHHAAADAAAGAGKISSAANICPAPPSATTMRRWQRPPATSAPRSSIPSAPRRWARRAIRWRWSTSACASTASAGCASPMPRSCRPSRRAIPTRRPR